MMLLFVLEQCSPCAVGFSTNIARNRNVGHMIGFNMVHNGCLLTFLATNRAYFRFSIFSVDFVFTRSHYGFHPLVQFLKINFARGVTE